MRLSGCECAIVGVGGFEWRKSHEVLDASYFYLCLTCCIAHVGDEQSGRTPVSVAADTGHEGMVRMLIEAKADPNVADEVGVLVCIHTRRSRLKWVRITSVGRRGVSGCGYVRVVVRH